MEVNAYTIIFYKEKKNFVLTNEKGKTIKVNSKHKKYEWLESQEKGKIVKINDSGRWTSSKDYDGLYDVVKNLAKKKIVTKKTVAKMTAPAKKTEAKVLKEKTSKPKAEKAIPNKADAKLALELLDQIEENKKLRTKLDKLNTSLKEEKEKLDLNELECMELEAQHDIMVKLLANNHEGFLDQAKKRTLTADNVEWALEEYMKVNASKAAPKKTPTPKQIKVYRVKLSYAFDERNSSKPYAIKGYADDTYSTVRYKDVKAPNKTLMKQLVTYFLLNSETLDSKFERGDLPNINLWGFQKVKVDIISINEG